jgi:hypothetical protein
VTKVLVRSTSTQVSLLLPLKLLLIHGDNYELLPNVSMRYLRLSF